jgi:integrase
VSTRRDNHEGTFYKRTEAEGGGWLFRIRVGNQRVSGSGPTRRAAKERAVERARLVGDKRTKGTVAELVEQWAALSAPAVGLKPTTQDQYRSLLRSRVVPVIGNRRVDSLTKRTVAEVFPPGSDNPASTMRSTYAALVRVLDYAVERGMLAVNVAREVKRPAAAEHRARHIDREAVARVLAAAEGDRLSIAAWLGFGCGLRRGEILALRWSEVDLDAGVLSVTGNVTRSSAGLVRGTPKTRRGTRLVPVPPVVVERLRAHRREQAAEQLAAGSAWRPLGMVVANEVGGMLEPRFLSRRWRSWSRSAGVEDTGTHVGRHYAASTLLASGAASVADVAAQLGHDPAVLLNTYAVAVAAGQRAAAAALGETLTVPIFVPIASTQDATT